MSEKMKKYKAWEPVDTAMIEKEIERMVKPAPEKIDSIPQMEDAENADHYDSSDAAEILHSFAALVDELNDLIQEMVVDLVAVLNEEDDQGDAVLVKEDDKPSEEGEDEEVLAVSVLPNHSMIVIPIDCCFNTFDWFGESEVCEPVPGVSNVYMTYDRKNLIRQGDNEWLSGPVVVYRVDEKNNIVSVSDDDVTAIGIALDRRMSDLFNVETGEKRNVFTLK